MKTGDLKTHAFNKTGLFRGVSQLLLSMIEGQTCTSTPLPTLPRILQHKKGVGIHLKIPRELSCSSNSFPHQSLSLS